MEKLKSDSSGQTVKTPMELFIETFPTTWRMLAYDYKTKPWVHTTISYIASELYISSSTTKTGETNE